MSTKKIQILGSVLATDATLTQSGVAADAKVVGDALAEKQPVGDYALASDIPAVPVQSVNGKIGAVVLTPEDLGAQPTGDYALKNELDDLNTSVAEQISNITPEGIGAANADHTHDDYALQSDVDTAIANIPAAPVQSVNGKTGAVELSLEDIGAQPAGDYITEETDPTVPAWAKAEIKPEYTAGEVGADPVGTATAAVSAHNTATDAHNDMRLLIEGLTTRLNALADSDDTTLDQMSEIVTYIKSNKSLIEDVTTNKVNVSDIINNLTTNVTNKPLSAAQGVTLKALIDGLDTDKLDASALTDAVNTALANAKASGEFDGTDGEDGVSATHSWSGTTLTVTSASGTSSANLKGEPGENGDDGVGITSVQQTTTSTEDDGNNIITVTLTNGTTSTFTVQNGSQGSKGDKGDSPVRGTDYWTEADKAEIKAYVDEAILGGAW